MDTVVFKVEFIYLCLNIALMFVDVVNNIFVSVKLISNDSNFSIPVPHHNSLYYITIEDFLYEVYQSAFKNDHFPLILQFFISREHWDESRKKSFNEILQSILKSLYYSD